MSLSASQRARTGTCLEPLIVLPHRIQAALQGGLAGQQCAHDRALFLDLGIIGRRLDLCRMRRLQSCRVSSDRMYIDQNLPAEHRGKQ